MAKPKGDRSIYLLFFLSGFTGLVYEVLWTRMFALTFGATAFAISTVLAAFMAGLALGSFYFGRFIDRRGDPLKVYAFLEILIGIYALLLPLLIWILDSIYAGIYQRFSASYLTMSVIRFVLSFMVLIVPTTMMGGTLPVLSKFVVTRRETLGLNVGNLYSINTIGGAAGCFAAGFILIALAGIRNTIYIASGVNLAIGAAALALRSWVYRGAQPGSQQKDQHSLWKRRTTQRPLWKRGLGGFSDQDTIYPPLVARLVILAFGLSGFAALAYEVLWTRVLSMILGTTVYAFSVMLTSFLCGLALGSFIFGRLVDRSRRLVLMLGGIQIAIGCFGVLTIFIFGGLPSLFLKMFVWLGRSWRDFTFIQFMIAFLVMLVPTSLMGAMFPLASRICTRRLNLLGSRIGSVYSANTVGSILGSLATGFLIIPLIGLQTGIRLIASVNVLVGLAALVGPSNSPSKKGGWGDFPKLEVAGVSRRRLIAAMVIAILFVALAVIPSWDKKVLASGVYFEPWSYFNRAREIDLDARTSESQLLYYADGIDSTVSVFARGPEITFKINGMPLASTLRADITLLGMMAHLPALLHGCRPLASPNPDSPTQSLSPESVLVVGLGAGVTPGLAAQHESVRQVECVELERKVANAARYFARQNRKVLDNPKFNLIIDDGRNFLEKTIRKYDIITSDPVHPWLSGAGSLYAVEHFQACKERLKEGGVIAQWLPLYQMLERDLKTVIRTFQSVFPHTTLWLTQSDAILIGTEDELRINFRLLELKFQEERIKSDMRMLYVDSIFQFLTSFMMSEDALSEYAAGARLNTDDHPILEFSAPEGLYSKTVADNLESISRNMTPITPLLYNMGDEAEASEVKQELLRYFEEKKDLLEEQIADLRSSGE